jgi:DNA-binding NarL/FixJ family response regulator
MQNKATLVKPIRVLLADDHTLVRAGIRGLLEGLPGVEVVGEAGDGPEAMTKACELRPDIVLLDVGMPGLNGLEVAGRIASMDAGIRVVILSMHTSEEYVLRALRAGCAGYLVKGSAVSELEIAVRAVVRGETYLSPVVSKRVVEDYVTRTGGAADPLDALTPRQREILQLVAEGNTSKDIARLLGLAFKTVETHRGQIMERLKVHDVAGLVRFAVRVGLVTPES